MQTIQEIAEVMIESGMTHEGSSCGMEKFSQDDNYATVMDAFGVWSMTYNGVAMFFDEVSVNKPHAGLHDVAIKLKRGGDLICCIYNQPKQL